MTRTNEQLSSAETTWTQNATAGTLPLANQALTAGALTRATSAVVNQTWSKFTWTNAQVVALGATTTGNILVCTLPARTVVLKALVIITGQGAGPASLTVSLGRVGTAYIDYIVASSAKAAAATVYGDAFAELGASLSGLVGDFPSVAGTTDVNVQFISVGANLSTVTGSTGEVHLLTALIP